MAPENKSDFPDLDQFRCEFHRLLHQRRDIGAGKIIGNWFFKPGNRFAPQSRSKLRPGILIVFTYFLLMAATVAAFNFR